MCSDYYQPRMLPSGNPNPSRWLHVDGDRTIASYIYDDKGNKVPEYFVGYINGSRVTPKQKFLNLGDVIAAVEEHYLKGKYRGKNRI